MIVSGKLQEKVQRNHAARDVTGLTSRLRDSRLFFSRIWRRGTNRKVDGISDNVDTVMSLLSANPQNLNRVFFFSNRAKHSALILKFNILMCVCVLFLLTYTRVHVTRNKSFLFLERRRERESTDIIVVACSSGIEENHIVDRNFKFIMKTNDVNNNRQRKVIGKKKG